MSCLAGRKSSFMKKFAGFLKGLRMVIKYAGLIIVIIDVLTYAADKIEQYLKDKDPNLKKELEQKEGGASQ